MILCISFSFTTMLTACDSHEHTFDTAWTTDAENHWKKATCEHTEEISEKAAHAFGEDRKCTVCGYERPIEYTVTAEQWAELVTLENNTNYSYSFLSNNQTSHGVYKEESSFTVDGKKCHLSIIDTYENNPSRNYRVELIIDETEAEAVVYGRQTTDGEFTVLNGGEYWINYSKESSTFIEGFIAEINNDFQNAIYNVENKVYMLTVASMTLGEQAFSNVAYTLGFEDSQIVFADIEVFIEETNISQSSKIHIEFDGEDVEIPSVS